jgi:hypothetical protein
VTAAGYQRALADCVASPDLCLAVRADPVAALAAYDLTGREHRRLTAIVRQPGMSTNCTLYRLNRATPIGTLLPLTCALLADRFAAVLEDFWRASPPDMQFRGEIEAFGEHVLAMTRDGRLAEPYLADVLGFELARVALQFLPDRPEDGDEPAAEVRFRHDPALLLGPLAEGRQPPPDLPEVDVRVRLAAGIPG